MNNNKTSIISRVNIKPESKKFMRLVSCDLAEEVRGWNIIGVVPRTDYFQDTEKDCCRPSTLGFYLILEKDGKAKSLLFDFQYQLPGEDMVYWVCSFGEAEKK